MSIGRSPRRSLFAIVRRVAIVQREIDAVKAVIARHRAAANGTIEP
jgi:hypothetical protein